MGGSNSPTASEDGAVAAAASAASSPSTSAQMVSSKKRKTSCDSALRPPVDAVGVSTSDPPTPTTTATTDAGPATACADASMLASIVQPLVANTPTSAFGRMDTALEMSRQLLQSSLSSQSAPLADDVRAAVQDACAQLAQAKALVDAAQATDVAALAQALQKLFVGDASDLARLRDASDRALQMIGAEPNGRPAAAKAVVTSSQAQAQPQPQPEPQTQTQTHPRPAAANAEDEDEDMEGRASTHEEVAAQALTGLRTLPTPTGRADAAAAAASAASSTSSSATATSDAVTASMGPPIHVQVPTPGSSMAQPSVLSIPSTVPYNSTPIGAGGIASIPTISPANSISIFAPHLQQHQHQHHMQPPHPHAPHQHASGEMVSMSPHGGIFIAAPPTDGSGSAIGASTPMGTPGSLPSIFARGLLAPISTPYDPSKPLPEFPSSPFVTSPMVPVSRTMLTPSTQQLAPFVDWKNLAPPQASPVMGMSMPSPAGSVRRMVSDGAGSRTPVLSLYRPAVAMAVTPNMTQNGTPSGSSLDHQQQQQLESDQQSPAKRKNVSAKQLVVAMANSGSAGISLPIAKSLAALERTHPARKANPRRWTKEEDDALRQAVENHKEKNWKAIAAQVPGRNHTQCLQRWTKVLAPGLVKGHWSPHEDELLKRLVAGGNKNWGEVAAKIPGRTSKQCRERWHNHLDPNIVRGAYTPEEDRIILEAQARLGNRWSVIAAMLPGRTEDAVKIRWKSHCRLWKARKYLRKSSADHEQDEDGDADQEMEHDRDADAAMSDTEDEAAPGEGDDDDDGEDDEDEDGEVDRTSSSAARSSEGDAMQTQTSPRRTASVM